MHKPTALPAHTIGPYRLLRLAGGGSTGVVFHAVRADGEQVALKLMRPLTDVPNAERRFDAETRILGSLMHPDIVQILEAGYWQGRPWLAMQWLPGHDLTRYTSTARLLPEAVVMHIGARLAAALAHAHQQGVVHRDIKPGNVRVNLPVGMLKLADFGLARHEDTTATPTGVILGSPAYMAPEVMRGERPDARADLYSLGVVLYELLSGRRPYEGATMGDWLRQVAAGPPPALARLRPDLPEAITQCVTQLMAPHPRARAASAHRVALELVRLGAPAVAHTGDALPFARA